MQVIKRHGDRACYSDQFVDGGIVYLRGITANDRSGAIDGQTDDCLRQIDGLLAEACTNTKHALTATIYLSNTTNKTGTNTAWLDRAAKPVRATVQTGLGTPETLVNIVVSAAK